MQRILVVEDEPPIAGAVAVRPVTEGFEVRPVADGPAAVEDSGLRTLLRRVEHGSPGGGTGLGLAIARRVVDPHGGQIAPADSAAGRLIRVVRPQPHGAPS
jgi:DNA-binding response OmpR family regulator